MEMELLKQLNELNDAAIYDACSEEFRLYGRILSGYGKDLIRQTSDWLREHTKIPEEGNQYVASDPALEELPLIARLKESCYGGMPVQAGYCCGRNTTYNGFEFHKGSEVNLAVTDLMLVFGDRRKIRPGGYFDNDDAQVFFVPAGCMIEIYQTTLHLSPLRVTDEGYRTLVVLPRGTNTPLAHRPKPLDDESRLLLQTNKWVIAHPQRTQLTSQGAFPGILGENKELTYPGRTEPMGDRKS